MTHLNQVRIKAVSTALGTLKESVVFVGGATVALYADQPVVADIRPTDDVDVVIELATYKDFGDLDAQLRSIGFQNDMESNVICRYKIQGIRVDVMPTASEVLGFSNRWYEAGFKNAIDHELSSNFYVKIFDAAYFIASKLEAFHQRGGKDFRTSTDFEDIVFVLANCSSVFQIASNAEESLKSYLQAEFRNLLAHPAIEEGIYAHIEPRFAAYRSNKILEQMRKFANTTEQ